MVWYMKKKRNPIGEILKRKARLCDGRQKTLELFDYWSTYSPVFSWYFLLMLVMAIIHDWKME